METIITERDNGSRRVAIRLSSSSHVEQHHKNETNINSIISRYNKTGLLPQGSSSGQYGDFTGATDYHTAQNRILQAQANFSLLPSDVRTKFNNDPAALLEFINDPANERDAIELGLLPDLSPIPNQPPLDADGPVVAPDGSSETVPTPTAPVSAPSADSSPT